MSFSVGEAIQSVFDVVHIARSNGLPPLLMEILIVVNPELELVGAIVAKVEVSHISD